MAQKQTGEYAELPFCEAYISNREITNTGSRYLVRGSQNVLIKNKEKVVVRSGSELLGDAKTVSKGIDGSTDWQTNTNLRRSLRGYDDELEVWYESAWRRLKNSWVSTDFQFTTWWNNTELIDILLFVNGSDNLYEWSGAITTVASVTTSTITKKGYKSATTIAFLENGASKDTITDSGSGFVTAGFEAGDIIVISGSTSNNGEYTISAVVAGTITLITDDDLANEAAGASVVIKRKRTGTWAEERFFTGGRPLGTATMTIASPGVVTKTAHGLAVNDTIRFSTTGALPTGLTAGTDYYVISAGLTADAFQVSATLGGSAINTSGSQSGVHTLTKSTRKVIIDDVEYGYTGGEGTGTLTGVTPDPSAGGVAADDIAFQAVRTIESSTLTDLQIDLISVLYNQVWYGSTVNRRLFLSNTDDFADFSYTSPLRKAGEGFTVDLDSCPTAFIPDKTRMYVGAGNDDFYRINTTLSADQSGETITVEKLATATGQAPINQDTVINIKNSVAFLTIEKTIDTLGDIQNIASPQTRPISDDIKDDLARYDITDAAGIYFNRELRIALPREGIELIYDMQWGYWQPPQYRAISRYAIIEVDGVRTLCGHSSSSNETYILDTGRNDNGATYKPVATFGYDNFGSRFEYKNHDELATELYATKTTLIKQLVNYDYLGSTDQREFEIDPNDEDLVFERDEDDASFGVAPLGNHPLGMSTEEMAEIVKVRIINTTDDVDFFERQRIYYSESEDPYFEILGMGENVEKSENLPSFIKR
jgi:hypothetical protein